MTRTLSLRLWVAARYDGSAWFRLAVIFGVVAVNWIGMVGISYVCTVSEVAEWLQAVVWVVWMLALSIAMTWLVIPPYPYERNGQKYPGM
jgi:hypothetical protein